MQLAASIYTRAVDQIVVTYRNNGENGEERDEEEDRIGVLEGATSSKT